MPLTRKKKPSPEELLAEVRGRGPSKTYEFEDYMDVIHEMKEKKFSFAKIAEFLSTRLGYPINRGQVYRAYDSWEQAMEIAAQEEAEQKHAQELYDASQGADESDFDPEEYEKQKEARMISEAAGDILKYFMDKYPKGAVSENRVVVFKRVLAFIDPQTRDDLEAELSDQRLEEGKENGSPELK